MKGDPEERAIQLGEFISSTGCTVRVAAARFSISKSSVHKDITDTLRRINPALYRQVRRVLDRNKAERHLRGGQATRMKYRKAASL